MAGLLAATSAQAQMGMGGRMGGGGQGMMGRADSGVSYLRHRYVMANGVDPAYRSSRNPLTASTDNLKAGKAVFEQNCVACHGAGGRGDGPAAKGLNPVPADLTVAMKTPLVSDAYLDWTISEGGVPVHSVMPSFKTILSADQRWKLVLYLRTL